MDIVERLCNGIDFDDSREAADEIERLRAENAELRATVEAYKNQEPVAWLDCKHKSFFWNHQRGNCVEPRDDDVPLFTNQIEVKQK